ncbi:MAG: 2-amino-4-hydroxy-6-hydroxymethyldihydropteridine diphosphokinase [Akkermansiaceae bacterium]|jgi:2-amino-4-hydroxy-6-hydroxymethyldihydropteridine diphosphokinase|nr:2-amino-4-hydroxy-6-hydroxymethyldihydropteridine diphosphokinase [Akkermansiaceae bacterium]
MPRVGIALGSNLGDRAAHLQAAMDALQGIAVPGKPYLTAPIYQTEPRFCPPGSPQFLNTVVEIEFPGTALDLLEMTQAMEIQLGRVRGTERNAPRVIDIDLLYFGNETLNSPRLELPHPRIGERRFVLQPLADIRPDMILPGHSRSIAELLRDLESDEPPLVEWTQPGSAEPSWPS